MTVDELQNFIADKVHANVDDKIVGEIMNDAANMDYNSFANKWDDFLMEHSEGWSNTRPSDKDVYTRIREAYGSSDKKNPFIIPENYSDEIYESKFKDVPKAEYNKALQAMAKHWDNEKLAREYEAGRVNRANEVKKGGPKWWLASEYSKNRYINEPEKSIFSDKGEWYNKGDDIRDVMLGGIGAVSDFIPGYWAMLGPAARGIRDYANYGTPYGKDASDIARERGLDNMTSLGAALLPNFRKGKRMFNTFAKDAPGVGNIIKSKELNEEVGTLMSNLYQLSEPYKGGAPTFSDITKRVNAMPDGYAKTVLQGKIDNFKDYGNPEALKKFYDDIGKTAKNQLSFFKTYGGIGAKNGNLYVRPMEVTAKDIPEEAIKELVDDGLSRNDAIKILLNEKNMMNKKMANEYSALRQKVAETKPLGPIGIQIRDKVIPAENFLEQGAAKRLTTQYEAPISDKDRKLRDWYKEHYARDWSLDNAFKPNEKPGDPLWEAWKEWDDERKGIK